MASEGDTNESVFIQEREGQVKGLTSTDYTRPGNEFHIKETSMVEAGLGPCLEKVVYEDIAKEESSVIQSITVEPGLETDISGQDRVVESSFDSLQDEESRETNTQLVANSKVILSQSDNRNNCLENITVDQTKGICSQGVETRSEPIEKVESKVPNKEDDDFEYVLATPIEYVILEKLDNEKAAFMLGETCHPSSEATLQNKLESSETIEEKIQMNKEDEFVNAQESSSCIEHLDNQGEPTSGPETVIDAVTETDSGNTLVVENSQVTDIKDEQQEEESISGTEEEAAVRDYEKPFNKVSEYFDGAATDEQADFIQKGQPVTSVEEQRVETETTQVDQGETDCTKQQRLLTTETTENGTGTEELQVTPEEDETIDIGINEKSSTKSEILISEQDKYENKMQMVDVPQESLAEDFITHTEEQKVQIDTSDEFNQSDKVEDTLPDSLTEKLTEGYQDNEKEAEKLSKEVVDDTNEDLIISSSNAKHETNGEVEYFDLSRVEDEPTDSASNDKTAEPPNCKIITTRDETDEEDNMQVKDVSEAPVAETTISEYGNTEENVAQEDAIEEFIEDDQVKGNSLESPPLKMAEGDPDDAREASELTGKNPSVLSKEAEAEPEEASISSSLEIEADNDNLSTLEDEISHNRETNTLTTKANVSENIISQDDKRGENVQMEDFPRESDAANIISESDKTAETNTKHTSEEFIEETGTSTECSTKDIAEECSDDKQAKELSKENFENLSTVSKEVETEHCIDTSIEKYETTAEGANFEVEEHADDENLVGGDFQDDNTQVKTIQLQDISPEPSEESIVCQTDQVKNLDEGYQDDGNEAEEVTQEVVDTETEDPSISSSTMKHAAGEEVEYLDKSRVEDVSTDSGDNENTVVESPKHDNIMEEASSMSGNIIYPDDSDEEIMMQAKDIPTAPVEEIIVSQYSNTEEKFVEDTTEVLTEDDQVKGTSPEPPQENVIDGNTVDGKETNKLPEKKLEIHSALSEEFKTEHEDLSNSTSIVKDETNAEAENDNLSGLECEISENGDNKALTAIEEISENIIDRDEKREEETIEMEDISQESLAEKIISQCENTAEKVTQIEHPSHESTEELRTSPDSPADEIAEEYSDHREAEKLPEEIYKNLSVVSKEENTDNLDQSIDPSIDQNEKTAEGENEKLGVEEHPDDESIVGARGANFQDDNAELKITQLGDVSPKPMEENIVTEDQYIEGSSTKSPVAEGHIEDGEETKEKYDHLCIERIEEDKEHEDLIHDSSKCEISPEGDDENLKVQEHPKDESPTEGNIVSEGEIADEEKAQSEDSRKYITEDDHVIGTPTEASFEKIVEINVNDVKVTEEVPEEMSDNRDHEELIAEASAEDEKMIEGASPVAVNIISQANENEEKETQPEATNEQIPDESDLVDDNTAPESLAKENAETSTDDVHEAIEGASEQYKEESNLEDTPSEPLVEKEGKISSANAQEGKGFTEEVTPTVGESFSVEHAAVERDHEDLGHDYSISNHATVTMEDNEDVIVEQKSNDDDSIVEEVSLYAGNTIHQEYDIIDEVKIQQEDVPETSMEGIATLLDYKNEEQNAQIEDNNEDLTKDEDETGISPGHPSEDVLQTTTNEEKEYSSEQKCENLLRESTEIEKDHEDAANDSASLKEETAKEYAKLIDDETEINEITSNEASSSIKAEVIHDDTALNKAEEFLPITISPDDKGTDQKALAEDKIEQATDAVKETNEIADLDKSEKDNDQLQKGEGPDPSEENTEEYNMETDQEELTREYHTCTSTESPDENIVNINGDDEKRENEINEENVESHSVERTVIGEGHEDLGLQTSYSEDVTSKGENKEFEEEETPEKEMIIEDRSPSILPDDNIKEKKIEIEDDTHESVEGSTVNQDHNTEEKEPQKDDISQQIEGSHATVASVEEHSEIGHETYATDGNKSKENIKEECESLTAGSTQEYNEIQKAQNDAKEETEVSSAIITETMPDYISLNNIEQFLSTDSSKECEGTEQTSDMSEEKTDTMYQMEEQNDQIQTENVKEQPAEIMEQDKMEKETALNDDNAIEGVGKEDFKTPTEEYEESASSENAGGILIATTNTNEPISLSTKEGIVDAEKKICEEPKEETYDAGFPDDKLKFCADDDAEEVITTEEGSLKSTSVHDEEDASDLSCREEGNEKQQTGEATCEQSESINEEVDQDHQTDKDRGVVESSNEEVDLLLEPVVDEVIKNQQELELKTQETRSTEEIELVTPNDQQRETANCEVSEENFRIANADERITQPCKELDFVQQVQVSKKETELEKTTEHVEKSSLATSVATDIDFTSTNHDESFSLGHQVRGKYDADEDGHDKAPDAQEKNDDEEEAASSATQVGDELESREETTMEPIKEVDGGTAEIIEANIEALAATNKDVVSQEEDDTEMLLTSEGHREADLTVELHEQQDQVNIPPQVTTDSKFSEAEELETIEEGKEPIKSNKANNSSAPKDDDTVNHESRKESLETEENQEDSATVEESAQTGTVAVIPEQDASFSTFNRSIQEVFRVEKLASAEEQNQQYEDSIFKNDSLVEDEVRVEHEDEIKEKGIHETEENQNDAYDLTHDEIKTLMGTELAQNEEQKVTDSEIITETEPSMVAEIVDECHLSNEIGQSSDNPSEIEDEYPKERIKEENLKSDSPVEKHENEIAAPDKETNEKSSRHLSDSTKGDINEESLRNNEDVSDNQVTDNLIMTDEVTVELENVDRVKNIQKTAEIDNGLQRDEIKTPTSLHSIQSEEQEASTVAETANECDLVEEIDQRSQTTTERYYEPSEKIIKENLESAALVEKHENVSETVNEEIKKAATVEKSICEVTPTEETETNLDVECSINREATENQVAKDLIMTSEVATEPKNEDRVLHAQEAAENKRDAKELCHNEIKSVISSESVQTENEQATYSNSINEIERSGKIETLYNNSEASTAAETFEECGLPDETDQIPENNNIGEHQLPQRNKQEDLESANLAANFEHETTVVNEETNERSTEHPASSTEETLAIERVTPTDDIETNSKVAMELENEEKSESIQELSEEHKEVTDLQQDEMKIVTSSEPVENESENAKNFEKIPEIESLDKTGTPYSPSEASAVANTLEECHLSDVVEETAFELLSHVSFQDVEDIRQNEIGAPIETSKNLLQKEDITQEESVSATAQEIVMQTRDFSSEIQRTGFSQDDEKAQATNNREDADTGIPVQINTATRGKTETTDGESNKVCEETTDVDTRHNSLASQHRESTRKHGVEENWHVLSVEDEIVSVDERAIEEKKGPEGKGEDIPTTGENIIPSSEWDQVSAAEMSQMEGYSSKDEIVIDETKKVDRNEQDKIGRSKPVENEDPAIIEASKEINVKATQKKSHNILSGVGSKVKHSISKVKKAITGKPSQPKNTSPKKATAKGD